jgi:NAD(P)-dependent dehydrogenase (short-subunit alcohol dehydrogenase family)
MNSIPLFPNQLDGCTVLIEGGTPGIGLAAVIQARAAGADVIVLGANPQRAEGVANDHGFAGWRAADVSRPEEIGPALAPARKCTPRN